MDNYFSSNLKYLREKNGLSKNKIANKLNVNQSTVSRWENGDMGIKVENAYVLADFLGVELPDLVGRDLRAEDVHDNKLKNIDKEMIEKIKDLSDDDKFVVISVVDKLRGKNDS